jgi:hypothetical protein
MLPKKSKAKFDSESTSLLNLLDSLYESGMPKVESEEDAIKQMTPGQKDLFKPSMDMTPIPAALNEDQQYFPKKKKEDEEEVDERVNVPENIAGSY